MPYHLAIIRFSHEGNSFNPVITDLAAFKSSEYFTGEQARAAYDGTQSEPGGAIEFLNHQPDWQARFLRCAAAPPGGPIRDDVIRAITQDITEALKACDWDGVYVSLHGAMISESEPCTDLNLLKAIRECTPQACIAATFDLHANMAPEISELIDIGVGYKTYPHVDMAQTACKALRIMDRTVRGEINPRVYIARVGAVLLSHNMRTDINPMLDIENSALELENREGLYDVTPFGGFSFADSPVTGASVMVCGENRIRETAEQLATRMLARRDDFTPILTSPEDGIKQAMAAITTGQGPVGVLEPADNPMSGGIGDTPGLFAALIKANPDKPAVFAFFCDPVLVARAHKAGSGAIIEATFGARISDLYGPAIKTKARVGKLTDGTFINHGPMWQGLKTELGSSAVLHIENTQTSVIVTANCISPNDGAYFELHDIELANINLLCCKAKNHFRAAFGGTFETIIDVNTPGPATGDLKSLPFTRLRMSEI